MNELTDAQAALAAKDVEIARLIAALRKSIFEDADKIERLNEEVKRLKKLVSNTLSALEKFGKGCEPGGWAGWENGDGEEVGAELDAALAAMIQEAGK